MVYLLRDSLLWVGRLGYDKKLRSPRKSLKSQNSYSWAEKFLKSTDHPFDGELWASVYEYSPTDKHLMIFVTYHDATAYAIWAGKRLPTEAEWGYATRGGLVDKTFTWGDDEAVSRDYSNSGDTDGKDKWEYCAPAGSFRPNGYGLYDMAGNVYEWCKDWYNANKKYRVFRGGSWFDSTIGLRVAGRLINIPMAVNHGLGYRCVSSPAAQQ